MNRLIPLIVAVSFLTVGCTGSNESGTDAGAGARGPAGGGGQTSGSSRNACELLTAEDVAALHGQPVVAKPGDDDGPSRSSCRYLLAGNDEWDVVFLTVHWRDGKEEWDRQQAGREIGVKMMSTEGDNVDSITRPDPLAGIGDTAYYGNMLPSLVLEGDVLLEFMMPLLQNSREKFPVLAKKAVSRL